MEARNELESYAYSLKNQIGDKEKLGGKLDDNDKKTIESALDDAISWLESHKVNFVLYSSICGNEFYAKVREVL